MHYSLMLQTFIVIVHIVPEVLLHRPNVRGESESHARSCIGTIKQEVNYA